MIDRIRKVSEIEPQDREALEHVLGTRLLDDQQIVIRVLDNSVGHNAGETKEPTPPRSLPAWCNVYKGLSDDEIADAESAIVRSSDSRAFE